MAENLYTSYGAVYQIPFREFFRTLHDLRQYVRDTSRRISHDDRLAFLKRHVWLRSHQPVYYSLHSYRKGESGEFEHVAVADYIMYGNMVQLIVHVSTNLIIDPEGLERLALTNKGSRMSGKL